MMNLTPRTANQDRLKVSDYAFILFMFLIHFEYIFVRIGIEDTVFKPYRVVALLCVVIYMPRMGRDMSNLRDVLVPIFVAFLYAYLVTFLHVNEVEEVLYFSLIAITNWLMILAALSSRGDKSIRYGLVAFCLGVFINIAFGFFEVGTTYRMVGFYRNPNHLGATIGCTMIIILYGLPGRLVVFKSILLLVLALSLVVTGSRGAILASIVGLTMVSTISSKARAQILLSLGVIVIIFSIFGESVLKSFEQFGDGRLTQRFSAKEIERGAGRMTIARSAIAVGWDTGFIGIGMGRYRSYHLDYLQKLGLKDEYGIPLGTHNFYISLLVEWGVPGLLAFLFFAYRASKTMIARRAGFIWGILVFYAVMGVSADLVGIVTPWVMLGIFLRMELIARRGITSDYRHRSPSLVSHSKIHQVY